MDWFVPGTIFMSSRIFVTFSNPPIFFLNLDRQEPRSGKQVRHVISDIRGIDPHMVYEWCYADRICTHCRLTGHFLDTCLIDTEFSPEVLAIHHVNSFVDEPHIPR
eukprot:TRINITY_DN3141_c0_g2_i10.p1 TRINITY_DN3141_c0_g2~~TRINITY_DN3141_c0_g2_i10.p1  ORF type:complete len:106 (+),score=4.80 TRINITY_DN3141_c0_g2_i10:497-814(+)